MTCDETASRCAPEDKDSAAAVMREITATSSTLCRDSSAYTNEPYAHCSVVHGTAANRRVTANKRVDRLRSLTAVNPDDHTQSMNRRQLLTARRRCTELEVFCFRTPNVEQSSIVASPVVSDCDQHIVTSWLCHVITHQRSTLGYRAFSVAGPIVWNSLPYKLRDDSEENSSKQSLKTLLFSQY